MKKNTSSPIFSDKTKGKHFHSIKCFIVNLCAINDDGGFERLFWDIPRSWINVQQVDNATFLNLNMAIRERVLYIELFDKSDLFPFSIVKILHIKSNIHQIIICQQSRVSFYELLVSLCASKISCLSSKSHKKEWNNKVPNIISERNICQK